MRFCDRDHRKAACSVILGFQLDFTAVTMLCSLSNDDCVESEREFHHNCSASYQLLIIRCNVRYIGMSTSYSWTNGFAGLVSRVHTDPGKKFEKSVEFKVEIFQALKSLENDLRYGKVWKDTWKLWSGPGRFRLSLHCWLLQHLFVTLLAFHELKELSFFQNFESHLVLRNIQQSYSAQTANTICSLRNFNVKGVFKKIFCWDISP